MSVEEFIKILKCLGMISLGCYAFVSVFAVQGDRKALVQVRTIFVESYSTSARERQVGSIEIELRKSGFEPLDEPSQADAILSWESQAEIVLHGDGSVPDKSIFKYQLLLRDKTVIWKHSVKFVSKKSAADDLEYAAQKVAKKLFDDKQRALKKTR